MEMFHMWSRQIHGELSNMAISIVSSLVRFIAYKLPKKNILLDYNTPHTEMEPVDQTKTIITVDFKNLLIETSRYEQDGLTKLNLPIAKSIWEKICFWRNVGYYYKRRPGYDKFVKILTRIPNTLLYLYTSEERPIADRLLEELRLTQYIPPSQRLYRIACKIMEGEVKKHPAYVDHTTQRYLCGLLKCDYSNIGHKG
jgi:hypothetical protein